MSAELGLSRSEREQFVIEQYERLWSGVLEKAEQLIAGGERDLKRLHLLMRRNFGPEFSDQHLAAKYRSHERKKAETGFIYDRQLIRVIDADTRVITLMTDAVKMRAALDAFGPDVGRIVETGSGWGKTLFNLYLYGAPAGVEYFALELTQTGRKVTELVARECAPRMHINTQFFNYYEPDFSMLMEPRKTCFVTHHSIEQIPVLEALVIERMLATPGFHRCVHLEPCGFQIPGGGWLVGQDAEKRMEEIDAENLRFSTKKNQNKNLYPLLRQLEHVGKIKMHVVRKHFTSHLLANATSLIVWGPGDGRSPTDDELATMQRDDLQPFRTSVSKRA